MTSQVYWKNFVKFSAILFETVDRINGLTIKPHFGTCSSYNIFYALHRTLCDKYYIGRTTL